MTDPLSDFVCAVCGRPAEGPHAVAHWGGENGAEIVAWTCCAGHADSYSTTHQETTR